MKIDLNIAIISASTILFEGLRLILKGCEYPLNIDRYFSTADILPKENELYDIIIVDSASTQNNGKFLHKMIENFSESTILGFISSTAPRDFTETCHELIYIDDSASKVVGVIEKLIKSLNQGHKVLSENPLSDREKEVLKLLVKGDTAKEIAAKLFISTHTVVTHRKNISAKLGIKTTSAMAIYAVSANLVTLDDILDSIPNSDEARQ